MQFTIENRNIPEKQNFLLISSGLYNERMVKNDLPVYAIEWNKRLFPLISHEYYQSLEAGSFLVVKPEETSDLISTVCKIFETYVNNPGELDFAYITIALSKMIPADHNHIVEEIGKYFGQRFQKNKSIYNWITACKDEYYEYLFDKKISPKILYQLKEVDEEIAKLMKEFLGHMKPSDNMLKKWIHHISDIAVRDNVSIKNVIENIDISVLQNSECSSKEKIKKIDSQIELIRYPLWSKKHNHIKRLTDRIQSKTGVKVSIPEFAEGDCITLLFHMKTELDLDTTLSKLKEEHSLLIEILEELQK